VANAAGEVGPRPTVTRLAWALCVLSVALAVTSVALAAVNGENLLELVANHHAIGILDALVLAPIGALIVPGGDLASWLAVWTNLPGIVISVVFLVLLFPDGRLPSRRWRPLGLAGAVVLVAPAAILAADTWPLRGPALVTQAGREPDPVVAMFWVAFTAALVLGAISVVALVLRFRRAGAVQRQQIKWFVYGAAPSIPLGMFPEARPYGPYLEFLGAVLQLAGLGIGIFRFRLWDIDRLVNRTLVYGLLTVLLGAVYAGMVLTLGHLSGGIGARTIERFSARLRDQIDLDTLAGELLATVDQTMRPAAASLWLRPSAADQAVGGPRRA
jgi:hypothetical protein